jgi:alginate O-acetyltransferase complex protein AlgI
VVLPPGISFYTFQALAYITDVYFKKLEPAENLIDYALFISFFPHLIAGPIQRPGHLLPQTQKPRTWNAESAFDGLQLIAYGLVRKCIIADNCALLANAAFGGQLGEPSLPVLLLGTYAFAWQIYGDFAGYSDIARGSAQLMGFHFMVNFKQPYLATSLQDFWRRWHISLSTWLRDYLYIPLGGNRGGELLTYRNLFLTMLIGGFWHGANWTFLIWGIIHGLGLAIERFFDLAGDATSTFGKWTRRIVIFHVVCVAWVFFRAESLAAAWRMLRGVTTWNWRPEYGVAATFLALFALLQFAMDLVLEHAQSATPHAEYPFAQWSITWRVAAAAAAVVATTMLAGSQANAFIYFQF